MWSAIEELQEDVSAHRSQQGVVAHSQPVRGFVAAWILRIHGGHDARIWSDQSWDRKHAMAVCAAACGESGNHGVSQPWKQPIALTAVVQGVFLEDLCQGIAGRRSNRCDAEVGSEPFAVTRRSLFPLWRSVFPLVNARHKSCPHDGIRTERIEGIVAEFGFLRRR